MRVPFVWKAAHFYSIDLIVGTSPRRGCHHVDVVVDSGVAFALAQVASLQVIPHPKRPRSSSLCCGCFFLFLYQASAASWYSNSMDAHMRAVLGCCPCCSQLAIYTRALSPSSTPIRDVGNPGADGVGVSEQLPILYNEDCR